MSNQEVNSNLPISIDAEVISQEFDVLSISDTDIKNWKEMTIKAMKLTTEKDWVAQDGEPYLQHSGAERIAKPFGVSIFCPKKPEKIVSTDDGGMYYIWVCEGDVTMRIHGRIISQHAVGTCSSRDTLYGMKGGEYKALSQVDEPSVMKAAHTNLIVNGITHMLGLRNLTWGQLEDAGLKIDLIKKVDHRAGSKGGSKEKDLSDDAKKKLAEILKWGLEMNDNDEKEAARYFEMISEYEYEDDKGNKKTYRQADPRKWSEKGIHRRYEQIKREHDKFGG